MGFPPFKQTNVVQTMNLLVLDTSTERGVIGIVGGSGSRHVAITDRARRHGRDLIPRLMAVLCDAGLKAGDIEVIAVGLGPGSYTGLRVGLTAAKALAYATEASFVGLDSLEAVALNAPAESERVSIIADAQRGQIYVADFIREAPAGPLLRRRATRVESILAWLTGLEPETLVLGPGLDSPRIQSALPAGLLNHDPVLNYPDGHRLIELAIQTWASGRRDDHWLIEPNYLRQSSAEELWDARRPPRAD
jgi:tRNA threonylcarbamoyladenosine biosynthesis protein TsaB